MTPGGGLVLPLKCERCGGRLGLQDPGTVCGHCKYIEAGSKS